MPTLAALGIPWLDGVHGTVEEMDVGEKERLGEGLGEETGIL